jgi:hypothetical protein
MSSGGKKYHDIFKKSFSGKFPLTEGKIRSVYSSFPQLKQLVSFRLFITNQLLLHLLLIYTGMFNSIQFNLFNFPKIHNTV